VVDGSGALTFVAEAAPKKAKTDPAKSELKHASSSSSSANADNTTSAKQLFDQRQKELQRQDDEEEKEKDESEEDKESASAADLDDSGHTEMSDATVPKAKKSPMAVSSLLRDVPYSDCVWHVQVSKKGVSYNKPMLRTHMSKEMKDRLDPVSALNESRWCVADLQCNLLQAMERLRAGLM
jgi:hypothetical protein